MGNYFSVSNRDTTTDPHDEIKDFEDLGSFKNKYLVVLDLSGTLIERLYPKQARKLPQKPDLIIRNINHIYKRPHLTAFLKYLFDNFTVCIRSNMSPKNINPIIDLIFTPEQKTRLLRDTNENWTPLNTISINIPKYRITCDNDNALNDLVVYLSNLKKAEQLCKHIFDVRTYLKYHKRFFEKMIFMMDKM